MLFLEWDRDRCIGHLTLTPVEYTGGVYIDNFYVDPAYARRGVGHSLAKTALAFLKQARIDRIWGVIRREEFHDKSAYNALRMGMSARECPYTYVEGDVKEMCKLMETA